MPQDVGAEHPNFRSPIGEPELQTIARGGRGYALFLLQLRQKSRFHVIDPEGAGDQSELRLLGQCFDTVFQAQCVAAYAYGSLKDELERAASAKEFGALAELVLVKASVYIDGDARIERAVRSANEIKVPEFHRGVRARREASAARIDAR